MLKFNLIQKEIEKILLNSPIHFDDVIHSQLVLKYILKLKPNADEALKIAACSHDIDRGITQITEKDLVDYTKIDQFKRKHALRSAKFISEILIKHNYPPKIITKVKHLVANHEVGGDRETNILKSADSLAYFAHNIPLYIKRNGQDRAKEKIKFMYKRLPATTKKLVRQLKFKNKKIENLVQESLAKFK